MKKVLVCLLALAVLMLSVCGAGAEEENVLDLLDGRIMEFTSGAGAWGTEIQFGKDGVFSGSFHDTEMGDAEEAYPNGTVYFCSFIGRLSLMEQVDDNCWKVKVEELEPAAAAETIEDGVRYVPEEIYGLAEGDEMLLYRPGTPVSLLSEDMQFWAHVSDQETPPLELEDWFLMSEANNSGFIAWPQIGLANPWTEVTAEELADQYHLVFGVPEGAENVTYQYLASEGLAQMQFIWEGCECCARIQPVAVEKGQLCDISGMYFLWENEEEIQIGSCYGTLGLAKTGSEDWVERCLWYDAETGLQYSLSASLTDPDGLDLTALAEMVYHK